MRRMYCAYQKRLILRGLHIANTYVKSDVVRGQLKRELDKQGYSQPNVMGLIACEAAYKYGAEWLEQLKAYLEQNLRLVRDYIACIKGIELVEPQGTYLVLAGLSCFKTIRRRTFRTVSKQGKALA